MKKIFSLLLTISICQVLYGQGNVGIGTITPAYKLQVQTGDGYGISHTNGTIDVATYIDNYAGGFIGTKSNHPFQLYANDGINQFILTPAGNVGIGTIPQHRLDVHYGSPRSGIHPYNRPFYVSGDIEEGNGIEFRHSNATQGIGFSYNTIYATGYNDDQMLQFASKGYAPLKFKTNGFERMTISPDGNVGIGTNPTAQLQLANSVQNRKIILYDEANNNNQFFGFGISWGMLRYHVNDPLSDHIFFAGSSDSTANELMRIKGNGNVGVGVSTVNNRMDINNGAADRTGIHGTGLSMYVTGDFGTASNGVEFRKNDASQGIGFGSNTIYAAGNNTSQDLNLAAKGASGNFSVTTNGTERMKTTGNGFTGFNVATPLSLIDVSFGPRTGVHGANNALYVTGWGEFRTADATQGTGILGNQISATGNNASVDLTMAAKGAAGNLSFSTNGSEKLKITGAGNFGFGVTAPANKLDVHNGTARTNTHNTGQALYVTGGGEFRSADATTGLGITSNTISATGSNANVDLSLAAKGGTGNISFSTNTIERLKIAGTGELGIGVPAPTNKLDVHYGTARSGVHATGQALYVTGGGEFRSADATQGLGISSNTISATGTNTSVDLSLAAKGVSGNLSLSTNGSEKLKITAAGNFGFGVTTPANKLDVHNGTARTGTHNTGQAFYVTGGSEFRSADATLGIGIASSAISATGSNANVDLSLAAKGASGNLSLSTNGTERLKITGLGNFGFGVTAPANKLDVHNGIARTGTHGNGIALYVTGGGEFRSPDATQGLGIFSNSITATGTNTNVDLSLAAKGATGNIIFNANGGEKVRISNSGNVGIGTSTPHAQLQLATSVANRKLVLYEVADNDNQFHGFGIDGFGALRYQTANPTNDHVFFSASSPTTSLELMRITGSGLVGIGVTAPHAALHFSNTVTTKKLVLYEYANNTSEFSGFGLDGDGSLRYEVPIENAEHVFYSGAGPNNFTELMRIGSINGLTIQKATTINSTLTTTGNVTVGGTLTATGGIVTEAFTAPTLLNGFTNYLNGYATAAYYKDKMGIVHLRGLVLLNANQNGLVIFTLPAGYRPATSGILLFTTTANTGAARIDIQADGDVVVMGPSNGWISLDGITFRAD